MKKHSGLKTTLIMTAKVLGILMLVVSSVNCFHFRKHHSSTSGNSSPQANGQAAQYPYP